MNEAESKKMWNKYHSLMDNVDYVLQKLSDFAFNLKVVMDRMKLQYML